MNKATFYSRDFILGIVLMALSLVLYFSIIEFVPYGSGRIFIQMILGAIYLWGVRYIFRCALPLALKLILCFWWVLWVFEGVFKAFFV